MIAVQSPDDYPLLIAQESEASFLLDKPSAGWATIVLVVRKPCGQEFRFPMTHLDIKRFIHFAGCALEETGKFAGRVSGDYLFIYEARRFEIRRGLQSIVMGPQVAEDLLEAMRPYVV